MAKFALNNKLSTLTKVIICAGIAYSVALTPAFAQMIVRDYQTNTTIAGSGTNVTITTNTVKNNTGFNSFSRFNVYEGYTVNLVVPSSATNLINLVHNEATTISGMLKSINTAGQISGNVFLVNPHGVTVSSSGVINVGSLTAITPTTEFMNNFFEGWQSPSATATAAVLNGTAPVNTEASIINNGRINALADVKLYSGNVANAGQVYTGAQFTAGDFVNVNTIENNPNLVIENGQVYLVGSNQVVNNGVIYTKDVVVKAQDISITNTVNASNSATLTRNTPGNIIVRTADYTDATNLYLTPAELGNVKTANLVIGSADVQNVELRSDYYNNNGSVAVKAGGNVSFHTFTGLAAKDDVVIEAGGNTTLGTFSCIAAGKNVNVTTGGSVVLHPLTAILAGDKITLNAGDDITAGAFTAMIAKGNVLLNAADDIQLNSFVRVSSQNGSVNLTAGDDITINAFVSISAAGDIVIDAEDKLKIHKWADLDAAGDVIIN
jgi:filamentous hemagglutinin family protein